VREREREGSGAPLKKINGTKTLKKSSSPLSSSPLPPQCESFGFCGEYGGLKKGKKKDEGNEIMEGEASETPTPGRETPPHTHTPPHHAPRPPTTNAQGIHITG
jgi:hypothetical protein